MRRLADEAVTWITVQDDLNVETRDLGDAMAASLDDAAAVVEVELPLAERPAEQLLERYSQSGLLPQVRAQPDVNKPARLVCLEILRG